MMQRTLSIHFRNPSELHAHPGKVRDWMRITLVVVFWAIAVSCQEESVPPVQEEDEYLVNATLLTDVSASQIRLLAGLSGLGLDVSAFESDVSIYRITYHTNYQNGDVIASGLVILPNTTDAVGMLGFQHGTIVLDSDAPSMLSSSDAELLTYGALSSSGFIGVVPDYLGFGASAELVHPYYVEEYTASAVIDIILAAGELADHEHVAFNGRLFLAGYSEGGYATLAAAKALEQDPRDDVALVATFAAAGGFDVSSMQSYLFGLETYAEPYYLAYVAHAYTTVYELTPSLGGVFNDPYATAIPTLFDGSHAAGQINAALTTDLTQLVSSDFREGLATDPAFAGWRSAFEQNSLTDWVPTRKLFLYHGEDDETIPYSNTQSTYDALIDQGASEEIVELISLPGNHGTAVMPFIQDFVPKLWALR